MEPILCVHCSISFTPRNKHQSYCPQAPCQRARKAAWQRLKIRSDPDYRAAKKLSDKKWSLNNPGYWKAYRKRNPEKVLRNRILQGVRNRRRSKTKPDDRGLIAKLDAGNPSDFQPIGQFWLVPLIAKLDARKVNIYTISDTFE
jgi:hypothetical protein